MPRSVLGYLDWAERLRTGELPGEGTFCQGRRGGPLVVERNDSVSFAIASIHTLWVSPLFGDSVHYGIRLFGLWRNDGLKVLPVKGLLREALVTGCPVARSVKWGIEISSELDLT